ncbi:MAG: hypothetical protein M3326_13560 [Actinomycetota bacterium]|nr:hypothetical protein [Actinomycetota bacterium]
MFVQVIEGRVRDRDGLRSQVDRWASELAPGAQGWLGSTAGVADDGAFVAVVRFESEQAAQANSDRPEQGAWWEETQGYLDGEVTFTNCPDVDTFGAGGSDDAGFVQFIQGRADRQQIEPVARQVDEILRQARPEVIGGIVAWPGDGTFRQVVYFTSEEEARKGEGAEMSPEHAEAMARISGSMQMERFVDLRDPWLASAG